MYDDVLQTVIDMAQLTDPYSPILTGSMPPDNGIAMTGQSGTQATDLNIGTDQRMTVVLNGKHTDQRAVITALDTIHRFLTRRRDYPASEAWQIYAIETVSSPRLLGREANSQWLYGSSLAVKFYMKGLK